MQLEGTPVESDRIDLHLTINFNEQWEFLPNGRIAFGLKGGKLKLKLENGTIPYEFRDFAGSLELSTQPKRLEVEDNNTQSRINSSLAETQTGTKDSGDAEQNKPRTEPLKLVACQVTTKGSQKNPTWVFEVETSQPVLKGSFQNTKLATLKAIALPCYIEATFEASLRDIYLTETEELWPQKLDKNQLAVLKRGIARLLLQRKLKPYLSRVKLQYD
jgi:hypothetical protein